MLFSTDSDIKKRTLVRQKKAQLIINVNDENNPFVKLV